MIQMMNQIGWIPQWCSIYSSLFYLSSLAINTPRTVSSPFFFQYTGLIKKLAHGQPALSTLQDSTWITEAVTRMTLLTYVAGVMGSTEFLD